MTDGRIAKLNEAARLIKEVGRTLDTRKSDCPCCGLTKYEDRTAHGCKEWLDAALQRVERVARTLKDTGL